MRLEQLSFQDLEELKEQITEYYETYYAELRDRLSDHTLGLSISVPDHLKGYRRLVTELGEDGAVVNHWPGGPGSLRLPHLPREKGERSGGRPVRWGAGPGLPARQRLRPLPDRRAPATRRGRPRRLGGRVDAPGHLQQARRLARPGSGPQSGRGGPPSLHQPLTSAGPRVRPHRIIYNPGRTQEEIQKGWWAWTPRFARGCSSAWG